MSSKNAMVWLGIGIRSPIYRTCRYCVTAGHLSERPVRTRFAPSPTGLMHLGGLRTALYSYLFAKKHKGAFVLRIEDTDQGRLHALSMESIWSALKFTNLLPDEGPSEGSVEGKGNHGPYVQSERLEIYQKYAQELLASGTAYRCFCSRHRLTTLKHDAYVSRTIPKYDNRCRDMSEKEVDERMSRNEKFALRLKLDKSFQEIAIHNRTDSDFDGKTGFDEGDFIILKSDGFPTYHFANVVDDHLMEISHVLRGVEWLPALPKHLHLYKILGFAPPEFIHLPLINTEGGRKLSKRQKDAFVRDYISNGYHGIVLLNYITRCGGGFAHNEDKQHISSLDEMCDDFDVSLLHKHPAVLNKGNLDILSRQHLKSEWESDTGRAAIVAETKELLRKHNLDLSSIGDDKLMTVLQRRLKDVKTLKELVSSNETTFLFSWEPPNSMSFLTTTPKPNALIDLCIRALNKCTDSSDSADILKSITDEICEENKARRELASRSKPQVNKQTALQVARNCLSSSSRGPPVGDMVMMLGRKESLRRLQLSVDTLRKARMDIVRALQQEKKEAASAEQKV